MKICITEENRSMTIGIPNWLLCSRLTAGLILSAARKHAPQTMEKLSTDALTRLLAEVGRVRKKHGPWELVDVESSDGIHVKVIL